MPVDITFKSLADSLENPLMSATDVLYCCDYRTMERPNQLHIGLRALFQYYEKHGKLPENNNEAQAQEVVQLAKAINEENKAVRWLLTEVEKAGGG